MLSLLVASISSTTALYRMDWSRHLMQGATGSEKPKSVTSDGAGGAIVDGLTTRRDLLMYHLGPTTANSLALYLFCPGGEFL